MQARLESTGYLYELNQENDTICLLCDGSHGNNTLCQMSTEDSRHEIC